AMKHKTREIEVLIRKTNKLKSIFQKIIPSKTPYSIYPKATSYVSKHLHYRMAFKLIAQCNHTPAPSFSGNQLLLGLKNLSIIYEIASLVMLHKSLEEIFSVHLSLKNFREHGEDHPFGGVDKDRPTGMVNNHFLFASDKYQIELFYEAKIYPMGPSSQIGDLIDSSNTKSHPEYGRHHFCPDYIVRINSKTWPEPLVIVFDAKFKDLSTIREHDINSLTTKYLLNIHQLGKGMSIEISPINMLIVLFAHDKSGKILRTVSHKHCITGQYPVLPQATAIHLKPGSNNLLNEHLTSLRNFMDEKYSRN
ncbi:TPA: hypothetical protein PXR61_004194, partial [Yersinia enterocolitica]|nr:hypothetical protein [Yersinia enterocolitica]